MKAKIICILVMTLLIATTLPAVGKTTESTGIFDSGLKEPNSSFLLEPTQCLRGYSIGVINAGYFPENVKVQLELWGATAGLINIPDITVSVLNSFDAAWVPMEASEDIDDAFKDDEIRDYISQGGLLIFCQPNPTTFPYIPKCLPYAFEIIDTYWPYDACAATILDPSHALTKGLSIDDMPDCYETVGVIAPEYTVLAVSGDGEPSFACAKYGTGKVVISMDAPLPAADICGDDPALSMALVMQMFDWAGKSKSIDTSGDIVVNRPILQFLQSHPNMFPLLQKIIQNLGL